MFQRLARSSRTVTANLRSDPASSLTDSDPDMDEALRRVRQGR
ncbi:hypothetical protein AB0957_18295 [Streptomyces zhihengii]